MYFGLNVRVGADKIQWTPWHGTETRTFVLSVGNLLCALVHGFGIVFRFSLWHSGVTGLLADIRWFRTSLNAQFLFGRFVRFAIKIKDVPASTGPMYALLSRYPCIHTLLLNMWFWRKFRCRKFHCDRIQSMYIVHCACAMCILLHLSLFYSFYCITNRNTNFVCIAAFACIGVPLLLSFHFDDCVLIPILFHFPIIFQFSSPACNCESAMLPLPFFIATHTHFADN